MKALLKQIRIMYNCGDIDGLRHHHRDAQVGRRDIIVARDNAAGRQEAAALTVKLGRLGVRGNRAVRRAAERALRKETNAAALVERLRLGGVA